MPPPIPTRTRVLIVDDSAIIRGMLQRALTGHRQIEVVGTATDGADALRKIASLRPDVVTLDVEMPKVNGIAVLERAAGKLPVSFLMVSTLTQAGALVTFEALRKGAFDYIAKPQTSGVSREEFTAELIRKVLAAARAKGRVRRVIAPATASNAPKLPPNRVRGWVVGIGISCGGPQTLSEMLPAFPSDFVPIIVTQHMPEQFTGPFAAQLDKVCAMNVREARAGEPLEQGTIYIAPGSHHLHIVRRGTLLSIELDGGPKVSGHRPSVDAMFQALARACGPRSVGVIMTGMGSDGAAGIRQLDAAGAWTVAQDEETSLVYGMPQAAARTGAVHHVAGRDQIPGLVAKLLEQGARTGATVGAGAGR